MEQLKKLSLTDEGYDVQEINFHISSWFDISFCTQFLIPVSNKVHTMEGLFSSVILHYLLSLFVSFWCISVGYIKCGMSMSEMEEETSYFSNKSQTER